ncbi:MAG TPA: thiamine diphosphokinase [Anaerolineaceae bacterium]|nr:thiamine diphosphokinase [Anaerolineaceae bacterium]
MAASESKGKRAWIFANGTMDSPREIRGWLEEGDLLIAVDGGSRHLAALGLSPDLLVGDLDSITPDLLGRYERQGMEMLRHPVEKNETDLELSLEIAFQRRWKEIRILGATGGRLDHTLGNFGLLFDPRLRGMDVRIVDARFEALAIWDEAEIRGKAGDLLSLIPVQGNAVGVWTEGLYYPLHHETLYPYKTRGISNQFLGERARIGLAAGQLLCIHTRV